MRGGIKTVLIPEDNASDLVEIRDSIKSGLEIVPVSRMDEVLARAMTRKPEPDRVGRDHEYGNGLSRERLVEEEVDGALARAERVHPTGRRSSKPPRGPPAE